MKKRLLSMFLCMCMVAMLLPTTALAAEQPAIKIGTTALSTGVNTANAPVVYYGGNAYYVIGYQPSNGTGSGIETKDSGDTIKGVATLFAKENLKTDVMFDPIGDIAALTNEYSKSKLKSEVEAIANALTAEEKAAVIARTLTTGSYSATEPYCDGIAGTKVSNASFWPLSTAEAMAVNETIRALSPGDYISPVYHWWLRSPGHNGNNAACVDDTGFVNYHGYRTHYEHGVRPAFNLNLNSVLFTSAAVGGKSPAAESGGNQGGETADAFFEIDDYNGNEWKLTLKDDSRNFSISGAKIEESKIDFSYSNAQTGTNEYISVVIIDNGAITHYGRILQLDGTTNGANGTASLTLPAGITLSDTTKLYVFNEQYNGEENDDTKLTDYASQLIEVKPIVDSTAPTLSNGSASRDSETNATVKFSSNEAGKYYYSIVDSGETEPTIDTAGTGTSCDTTEQTISLTNLSGTSAKDIYIVAKDSVRNVSDKLKIEIPAYIQPSYGIYAFPAALNFGSKTVGYTETPAASTVTLTNTGNQNITVALPTSTNYTMTVGEGFANGTATLEPNGTVTFTLQPNIGLAVGDYAETLTISGGDNASTQVALSFAVVEAAPDTYTLTVNLNDGSGGTTGGDYAKDAIITINAGTRANYTFSHWTSSDGGSFADASSASTTFTMPENATTITAHWTYKGGGGGGGDTTDYYTLTFDTNGGSSISSVTRAEYSTIDLTLDRYISTREGWEFTGWYSDEDLTDKITSIRLTKDTTIYAGWEDKTNPNTGFENPFTDVSESDWFCDDVMFIYVKGLMVGVSDTLFDPYGTTTRAMTATTIWRMEGSPEVTGSSGFTDVTEGKYYIDAVTWAKQNNIVMGYSSTLFGSNDPVTREQLAAFLYRYAVYKGYDLSADTGLAFADAGEASDCAFDALCWCTTKGIINGKDNHILDPKGNATRAEFAAMLHRFIEKNKPEEGVAATGLIC